MNKDIPRGFCQCGCGNRTTIAVKSRNGYKKGEPTNFIRGHVMKIKAEKIFTDKIKRCSRCRESKGLSEFNKISKNDKNLRSVCKNCERIDARKFYRLNPDAYKKRAKQFKKEASVTLLKILYKIKSERGCYFCKENEVECLDCHHIIKGSPVSSMVYYTKKRFETELNKCIVVCLNCHRKIHAGMIKTDIGMIKIIKIEDINVD